ncbi:Major facilitator superfamily domain [Phytophthora cactorum]|nr:Major facilitator superfamily domain [Phytophthora cactorum]
MAKVRVRRQGYLSNPSWPVEANMGSCRYVGIFGKRVSSLCCGHFSDKYDRTKTLRGNCVFMIVGGVVQAGVSNFWLFALGRLITDISPGTATIGGYINELPPPHMRDTLGLGL